MLLVLFACATVSQIVDGFEPMLPKIAGGEISDISEYPHAATLAIKCVHEGEEEYWACGSSILSEYLLLTAGHCTAHCDKPSYAGASVGSNNKWGPNVYSVQSYLKHSGFKENEFWNDIALISLKTPLKFSRTVGRVALMPKPPYYEKAYVAGWGSVSEDPYKSGTLLKSLEQHVYKTSECKNIYRSMCEGTICASSNTGQEYPSKGDSGNALVVRGYIQIGIVSFKRSGPDNRRIIYYTDTGYYYNWIQESANEILCDGAGSIKLL